MKQRENYPYNTKKQVRLEPTLGPDKGIRN